MNSIGVVGGGGKGRYYAGLVAGGIEDYYAKGKEAPGQWLGESADRLGLEGRVDHEMFHRVLRQRHPSSDLRLTRGEAEPKVAAFDSTFCAPKSVSLLYALGDPETSNQVRNAHDVAVAEAVRVFEEIARGRREAQGTRIVNGEGFVAAAFRHRTSRSGDPHLHTHVVIANLVYAPEDGRWSALDGRPLFQWAKTAGYLYEAQLRWELTNRLGVAWTPVVNGIADIEGIPKAAIKAFSTRRKEIDAYLDKTGTSGAKATQDAVYATRKKKDPEVDFLALYRQWRDTAAEVGLDDTALQATLGQTLTTGAPEVGSIEAEELFTWLASPEGLTKMRSTFGRREAIEAICSRLPSGGRIDDIVDLAEAFLSSDHVLSIGAMVDQPLRGRIRRLVPSGTSDDRWTTPEMLATEQRLIDAVLRGSRGRVGIADEQQTTSALDDRPTITNEQRELLLQVCGSGVTVDVVEGVAGAGKTFALGAAHDAWTASGYRVHGVCLAARAAARLEAGSGIPSGTLDGFLKKLDDGRVILSTDDVIVVDEAAMCGSRMVLRLVEHAERAGSKVVLVGDPRQLPSIEAGGAFIGITERVGAVELKDNRRQEAIWERAALAELRSGSTDLALQVYDDHGRVHIADDHIDAQQQLVGDWWHARRDGSDLLMMASSLRAVDNLNANARHLMIAAGLVSPDGVTLDGRDFAVGDRVLALRNDRRYQVLNGTLGTVISIDADDRRLTVLDDGGQSLSLPFHYADDGHLTHGYATTIHKAQGATVDRVFVLADESMSREHLYTAMSRGRIRNDLYLTSLDDLRMDERHGRIEPAQVAQVLTRVGAKSTAERFAIDQMRPDRLPAHAAAALRDPSRVEAAPPDPARALLRIDARLRTYEGSLRHAEWQRTEAQRKLDALGPKPRRQQRAERDDYEQLRDEASLDIASLTTDIERLQSDRFDLAAKQTAFDEQSDLQPAAAPPIVSARQLDSYPWNAPAERSSPALGL